MNRPSTGKDRAIVYDCVDVGVGVPVAAAKHITDKIGEREKRENVHSAKLTETD